MKNNLFVFVLIITLFLVNCRKEPVIFDMGIDIAYKNNNGQDLLNTDILHHFSADSIYNYNLIHGKKIEVNHPRYDYPHNYLIYKNDLLNEFFLRVFIETDTTILELNKSNIDTIVCIIDRTNGGQIIRKVWYNGILKWDDYSVGRVITILK